MLKRILAALAVAALGVGGLAAPANAGDIIWSGKPSPAAKPGEPPRGGLPNFDGKRVTSKSLVPPTEPEWEYYWSGGGQNIANEGANAGMRIWSAPYLDAARDGHSHAEIAVIQKVSGGLDNYVEIGWGSAPFGYCSGKTAPCLWGYHWIKGVPQGYNVNFTDWSSSLNLGDSLAGTTESAGCTSSASMRNQRFGIRWNTNPASPGWMLWADLCYGDAAAGEWLGQFNHSLWTAQGVTFNSSNQVQIFEEVPSYYSPSEDPTYDGIPCSDAGPGGLANSGSTYPGSGQRIGDVVLAAVPNSSVNMTLFSSTKFGADPSGMYNAAALATEPPGNVRYFNAGGPGSAGTTAGVKSVPGVSGGC